MASQTLTTRAAIVLHDGLTGKLAGMARQVSGFHNQMQATHSRMTGALATAGVGFGLQAALLSTERFTKAVFGVGTAAVEADEKTGKVDFSKMLGGMADAHEVAMKLSRSMRFSPGAIAETIETLAKAGMAAEQLEATARAVVTLNKADPSMAASKIADILHTTSIIQRPNQGESFGDFMRRQADMFNYSAASTKLGVGSIMEGFRQFQTIGASMGMKTEEMLPLLEAGVQHGFGSVETGTAVKSLMTRMIKRTAAGAAVLAKLGIDLTDKKFSGGASLLDGQAAVSQLNRSLGLWGGLKGADAGRVRALIDQATAKGMPISSVVDQITGLLRKKYNLTDNKSLGDLRNIVEGNIASPDGNLKVVEVLKALVGKGQSDEQIFKTLEQMGAGDPKKKGMSKADQLAFFEARHDARTTAILNWIRSGEYDQRVQALRRMKGQGLDAVEALWSKSAFGNVEAMKAAFERLNIVIANSPGIQRFVNWIERMADAISKADPMMIDLAARLALIGVVAGPVMLAAAAISKVVAVAWAGTKAFAAMNAALFLLGARGLASVGAAGVAAGGLARIAGGAALAGAGVLRLLGLIGRLTGIGLVAGGVWTLFENWRAIMDSLKKLGETQAGKETIEQFGKLFEALKGLGGDALKGIGELLALLGFKSDAQGVIGTIEQITRVVKALAAAATSAVEALRKLLGGDAEGIFGKRNSAAEEYDRHAEELRKRLEKLPWIGPLFKKPLPEADEGWDGKRQPAPLDRFDFAPGLSPAFAGIENSTREVGMKVDAGAQSTVIAISAMSAKLDTLGAQVGAAVANAVAGAVPRGAKGPASAPMPTLADGSGMGR